MPNPYKVNKARGAAINAARMRSIPKTIVVKDIPVQSFHEPGPIVTWFLPVEVASPVLSLFRKGEAPCRVAYDLELDGITAHVEFPFSDTILELPIPQNLTPQTIVSLHLLEGELHSFYAALLDKG